LTDILESSWGFDSDATRGDEAMRPKVYVL
jgi:hypothetical protein